VRKIIFFLIFMFMLPIIAVSSEAIHWGFQKGSDEKQAEAGKNLDDMLVKYDSFYKGSPDKKVVYLTFDNGYENGHTKTILDTLKKEKVPAAFFVTGHYVESASDLIKRMVKEGHIVGNHSWHHYDLTSVSSSTLIEEIKLVEKEVARMTTQKKTKYVRPPRGIFSENVLKTAQKEGYTHVMWSLAYVDWYADQPKGKQYAYDEIMKQIHPGAVIMLHSVSKDNAEALPDVIRDLKKQGYTFQSLSKLAGAQ
jgi:peptidoglycan-N-acetylmuramic acid deacetylase